MAVTASDWTDRYAHLLATRRPPDEPPGFESVDAPEVRVGDRLIWGDRTFTITSTVDPGDLFIRVHCEFGRDHLTIDLHRREVVQVLNPRPQGPLMPTTTDGVDQ